MRTVIAYIEQNRSGFYSVYTNDDFPFGFFGEGDTPQQAIEDFKAVYQAMKENYERRYNTCLEEVEFLFQYDVD